jgi:hypothetical protein
MKTFCFLLFGVAALMLGNVVRGADGPPVAPVLPPMPPQMQPAPVADGPCPCQNCQDGGHCCHGCEKQCCVPVPAKKKIEKVVYGCKCVEFCVPKCPGVLRICHEKDCNGCEIPLPPNCGHVRTHAVLIKKVEVKECPTCECVPPCSVQR